MKGGDCREECTREKSDGTERAIYLLIARWDMKVRMDVEI